MPVNDKFTIRRIRKLVKAKDYKGLEAYISTRAAADLPKLLAYILIRIHN